MQNWTTIEKKAGRKTKTNFQQNTCINKDIFKKWCKREQNTLSEYGVPQSRGHKGPVSHFHQVHLKRGGLNWLQSVGHHWHWDKMGDLNMANLGWRFYIVLGLCHPLLKLVFTSIFCGKEVYQVSINVCLKNVVHCESSAGQFHG